MPKGIDESVTIYLRERSPTLMNREPAGGDRVSVGQMTTTEVDFSEPLGERAFLRVRRRAP